MSSFVDILFANPTASLCSISLGLILFIYWRLSSRFGYWEKKGVYSIKPNLLFGNITDIMLQKKSMTDFHIDFYKKLEGHKYAIFYEGGEACLYTRDPELVKQVMIRDFDHFTDFGFVSPLLADISANDFGLANKQGEEWRALKALIIPAFSLKNMRNLAPTVNKIAIKLVDDIKKRAMESKEELLVKDIVSRYTMDCIAEVAFGIKIDAIANPDNDISKNVKDMFKPWRMLVSMFLPWVARILNIGFMDTKQRDYLVNISENVMKQRDANKIEKDDVLGLMMRIRDKGFEMKAEETDYGLGEVKQGSLSNDLIAKTMMQFFTDGYETVSIYITLAIYFLALNPDVQEKAIAEVDDLAEKCGDEITGDDINQLKYVDQVFSETGRIGGIMTTGRTCTKDWNLPGTDIVIPKGMRVMIPVIGMHMDPKYFPDPDRFDPDRFSGENRSNIATGTYMPFGTGPRQCIGMKIARLESKIAMYHILRHFRFECGPKTTNPLVWDKAQLLQVEGGVWVKFVPR